MRTLRSVWRVAREDLLDNLRQRSVLLGLVFAPLLVWVFIGSMPFLGNVSDNSDANLHATVAVSSNTPIAIQRALGARLRVVTRQDPETVLAFDEADAVLEYRGNFHFREVVSGERTKSYMTIGVAEAELRGFLARRAGVAPPRQHITTVAVADITETRGLIARVAPLLFVTSLAAIMQLAATRFISGRSVRTLEALLVRPIPRSDVLVGLATSSVILGLLGSALILVPFTAVVLAVSHHRGPNQLAEVAGTLLVVVVAAAWLFALLGIALAVSGKTLNAARVRSTGLMSGLTGVGLLMSVSGTVANAPLLRSLPVTDVFVLLHDAIVGTSTTSQTLRTVGVTVAVALGCLLYARHYLDHERVMTRA